MSRGTCLCVAMLSLLMAACNAQTTTHDPVRVEDLTNKPAFLTAKQYAVVVAARGAASATEQRQLMVTVFKGVLILYKGNPNAPQGLVKPGTANCLKGNTMPCRFCYYIIGSGSQSYCPQPVGLLPTGSRVINNMSVYWSRLDSVVHRAYLAGRVNAPWDPKPGHFFDATP